MSLRSRLRRARPPIRPLRIRTESGLPCRVPKDAPPSSGLPEDTKEVLRRHVDTGSPAFVAAQAAGWARRGQALRGELRDDESPVPGNGAGVMGEIATISVGPEARRLARHALPTAKSGATGELAPPATQSPASLMGPARGRELPAPPEAAERMEPIGRPGSGIPSAPAPLGPAALEPDPVWSEAAVRVRDQLVCPACGEVGHIEELDLVTGRLVLGCRECGAGWQRSGELEGVAMDAAPDSIRPGASES